MKNNMVKAIIRNNASGSLYRIDAETGEAYTLTPVTAVVDDDGETQYEDAPADPVTIPKKVFEVICSVVVPAPPVELSMNDVAVIDGRMEIFGEKVECGTLYINRAVAVMPGGVIIEVRSKDGEGIDLKFYDVKADRFSRMTSDKDAAELVYQDGDITAFLVEKTSDVNIPVESKDGEDGVEMYTLETAVDRSLRFYKKAAGIKMAENVYGTLKDIRRDGTDDVLLFATDDGFKKAKDADGYPVVIMDDSLAGKTTRAVKVTISHDEDGEPLVGNPAYRNFDGRILDTMYGADGNYVFIVSGDAVINMNTARGGSFRAAVGRDVVDMVNKYPVPVSIDVPSDPVTVFVFAKEDMTGLCRITVEKTRDRGFVKKIEEI